MPAPRPRLTKWGGSYYPAAYNAHTSELKKLIPDFEHPMLGELHVELEFVCKPMKASKFTTPMGDVDNLAKPIMDVLTQRCWWGDDRQIVELISRKRFAEPGEEPAIKVAIFQIPE
jgi:Holliday junction resolvase RusA-like endonuclease